MVVIVWIKNIFCVDEGWDGNSGENCVIFKCGVRCGGSVLFGVIFLCGL